MEHIQRYRLGSQIICPQTNTITNNAESYSLDNKSMQVLLFLILHSGEQVTKAQIFEHVWKDNFVAEDILAVAVSKIRKALGDNARRPTFIKTLPNIGYCLIANVEAINPPEQRQREKTVSSGIKKYRTRFYTSIIILLLIVTSLSMYFFDADDGLSTNQININSIAVLPFDDLSSTQVNQHFSDGLSDAIIDQLSQIKSLKVISRYSSFNYRGEYSAIEIGQALQVDTLLDGSVQTMGEQVRINVRIFSTKNGQQLWSKTFDSDIQDSFKLQDDISIAIQEIVKPDYIPSPTPVKSINAQAYEWYLMGQYHWRQRNPRSLTKAVTYFKSSLELEPDYAEAHVGLGITYSFLHDYGNWSKTRAFNAAMPHIEKALTLKPNSPTALAAKGMLLSDKSKVSLGELKSSIYQQAEQAFIRSLELESNATTHRWYASLLRQLGKESQAIQHLTQAIELNPLSAFLKRSLSFYFLSIGKPDSAQRMYQRALILEPDHFSHVIESTRVFRHTQKSIIALAEWQSANSDLFINCSSDEYCEQVVLAYLTIGAVDAANILLTNMGSKPRHFLDYLDLINFGQKGEEQKALSIKERLALDKPNSRIVLLHLAVAQFRAAKFSLAKSSLLQLYPNWRNKADIGLTDITADNYSALVLYAATLSKLEEKEAAALLLRKVQAFLKEDRVFDKITAEFTLAEINAQLGHTEQALLHLSKALDMGWLASLNREWWLLQNNHLLRPLSEEPSFKLLLKQHKVKRKELRDKVTDTLSVIPS